MNLVRIDTTTQGGGNNGNWLVSESTSKDDPRGDTSITERKIEYFE